jgi:hypothetical protein
LFSPLFSALHVDVRLEVNFNRYAGSKLQPCFVTQFAHLAVARDGSLMLDMRVLGDVMNELDFESESSDAE